MIGLHAEIGITKDAGADLFLFEACNPAWLQQELGAARTVWGRGRIVVNTFDMRLLSDTISEIIAQFDDGKSWPEFALRMNRYLWWEFEDYQPWVRHPLQ